MVPDNAKRNWTNLITEIQFTNSIDCYAYVGDGSSERPLWRHLYMPILKSLSCLVNLKGSI